MLDMKFTKYKLKLVVLLILTLLLGTAFIDFVHVTPEEQIKKDAKAAQDLLDNTYVLELLDTSAGFNYYISYDRGDTYGFIYKIGDTGEVKQIETNKQNVKIYEVSSDYKVEIKKPFFWGTTTYKLYVPVGTLKNMGKAPVIN